MLRITDDPLARGTAREAIASAFRNNAFLIMAGAYFECGTQLIFIATYLPSYLALPAWPRC